MVGIWVCGLHSSPTYRSDSFRLQSSSFPLDHSVSPASMLLWETC